MQLSVLIDSLVEHHLLSETVNEEPDAIITSITQDSRKIVQNGLFIAIRGEKFDGHLFIEKAIEKGASAIVCEDFPEVRHLDVSYLKVSNGRHAEAILACAFYGEPSRKLELIGVTGTNGKTTTTYLLHHLLNQVGKKTGLIGTIEYKIGDTIIESTHTTPDAIRLSAFFRQMVDEGCQACSMEVSSHALAQERVEGHRFQVAVFSNLTHDHLDFHHTFEEYFLAKKKLFDGLDEHAFALYNADDPYGKRIVADTKAQVLSYGQHPEADISFEVLENKVTGLRLRLDGHESHFRLVGDFNAYNLCAAYAVGKCLNIPKAMLLTVLEKSYAVPGRFEQIHFGNEVTAIVDYAHTPDALENVLKTILAVKEQDAKVWCVFGCGGDRDPQKRAEMGRIAEKYADFPIVTSDNPRTEWPEKILRDIREGIQHPEEVVWIIDRHEAITYAAEHAAPHDVVLIAGKGHEPYQIIGKEKFHFDDREQIMNAYKVLNIGVLN